ncbi:predicted protein [Nematostella vectensis]|uniref:Uncharacterized protein n=1 Tax=Nematostella vectensis TaxID=45351 RepID=A7SAX1_NEMVE|nr:predicted protein [Nematostella vectensis]|eukprot:XP_001631183.1 predicted protein [Nematostella vectensis]
MTLLKAGQLDCDEKQKLIASLNRGGLWSLTGPAEIIFSKTEQHFRRLMPDDISRRVNLKGIASHAMIDPDIIANYNLMQIEADILADKHVCKDVLHSIITLYVRVRSFSFAKDIIQKFKSKVKLSKAKSLRKEISRSYDTDDRDRQN